MRIGFYSRKIKLTGGNIVIMQHYKNLQKLGYELFWFTKMLDVDFDFGVPIETISNVSDINSFNLDVLITNKPKDYWACRNISKPKQVYLSRAYEVDHMNIRNEQKKKLDRYNSFFGKKLMDIKWHLKKHRIHKLYATDTVKWAVSPYLMNIISDSYNAPVKLVRNSYNAEQYYIEKNDADRKSPLTILSIGNYSLSRKNIQVLYDALKGIPRDLFRLIRVSPEVISDTELDTGLIDESYSQIPDKKMAELYRQADIVVSTSTDEGFGLPVIEGMACGALCVLAKIGAYENFATISPDAPVDYALFFDPRNVQELHSLLLNVCNDYQQFEKIRQNGITLVSFYHPDQTLSDLKKALADLVE